MNKQKWTILLFTLVLIGGTGGLLARLRQHQKLGPPAVKTSPLPGTRRLEVQLPELVLDYSSVPVEVDKIALETLPQDTSFGQRRYTALDGFETVLNVVLMGSDRTSIHKPQFCLEGGGFHIDQSASARDVVHVERLRPYDLPVTKLIANREVLQDGHRIPVRAVYVYWFVAENEATNDHWQRMWWMARDLLRSGVLQRWAYVSCLSLCHPGQEDATFERMKKFIAAAVPDFQQAPSPDKVTLTARQ